MDFSENTIGMETLYQGRIIRLETHKVSLQDGREGFREIIRHPGGVCILARDPNGHILLVEQYRKPMEEAYMELPAGKLEPNLTPEQNARKELEEETGYQCESLIFLGAFASSPGYSDEMIHLFLAEGLSKGVRGGDDDEFIKIHRLTEDAFLEAISKGVIKDLKTVAAYTLSKVMPWKSS